MTMEDGSAPALENFMKSHGNWVLWTSLVTLALCTSSALGRGPRTDASPEQGPTRLPLRQIPADVRESVRQILQHPTLFGHGPSESFGGDPELYRWLLDHPDRAMIAWRRLGAPCTEITNVGAGYFASNDGRGDEVRWRSVFENGTLRVWFAEGRVRPAPLLPSVPVRAVILMRHGKRPDGPDRTVLYHQADIYVQVDSKTAALVVKMLGPSLPRLAEEGLRQIEMFYSALVWYCDQHPERTQKLLTVGSKAGAEESEPPPATSPSTPDRRDRNGPTPPMR